MRFSISWTRRWSDWHSLRLHSVRGTSRFLDQKSIKSHKKSCDEIKSKSFSPLRAFLLFAIRAKFRSSNGQTRNFFFYRRGFFVRLIYASHFDSVCFSSHRALSFLNRPKVTKVNDLKPQKNRERRRLLAIPWARKRRKLLRATLKWEPRLPSLRRNVHAILLLTTSGPSIPALDTVAPNHWFDFVSICSFLSLKLFPEEKEKNY